MASNPSAKKAFKRKVTSQCLQSLLRDVSPIHVLCHLLETQLLKEDILRQAVDSLVEQKLSSSCDDTTTTMASDNRRTRHVALKLFYDGASYSGLAQNMGQENDNSVEKTLFQALQKAKLIDDRASCGYSRCGRTDRGVSAAGQVVALQLKSAVPPDATWNEATAEPVSNTDLPKNEYDSVSVWVHPRSKKHNHNAKVCKHLKEYPYSRILNNLLPPSIRVLGWTPVSDEFSARFSATTRLYRYFFCAREMNLAKIKQALQYLPGSHDFRNLCKMDVEKVYNFERKVFAAELRKQQQQQQHHSDGAPEDNGKDVYYLEILGQAFLWHQIRCIAEVMFMVGRGWEEPTVIQELLNVEKYPGKPAYSLADEKPLVLHDCGYKDLHMVSSVANLWTVSCQLEQQWEEHTLAAARLRNCITSLSDFVVQKHDVADFCMAKMRERQKKHQRAKHCNGETGKGTMDESQIAKMLSNGSPSTETIEWSKSLVILRSCDLIPDSQGLNTAIHVPLMLRSKGTTYEEKVEALKKSAKRREKFEENIVKKRKTAEEDAAFYKHMTSQGGGTRSTT